MALVQFKEVADVAQRAIAIAKLHQHEIATLEHVLCALLEHPDIKKCLVAMSVDVDETTDLMNSFMTAGFIPTTTRPDPIQSIDFDNLFMRVVGIARISGRKVATALDVMLLLAQLPHEDSYAVTALLRAGVTALNIKKYLAHGTGQMARTTEGDGFGMDQAEPSNEDEARSYLKRYATDLNQLAKDGRIDPLIGRTDEVEQIVQIIARRTKNNCILVGESGVGKTAVVEGLALKITTGDVPELLKNSTIYALDIGLLVAGAKFRGDFEERMKMVLKSLSYIPDAILFIDEIHNVMEAGSGSKGSMDVANMLKPALAKGQLRCIGSTTSDEYRKHIEKDRALVRRFKKVNIEEPSEEVTKAILRGLRTAYENFHGVTYTDDAIDAAVELTHKYVTTALLPDKAIDIIDNAGARQRVLPEVLAKKVITAIEIEEEVSKITKIPAKDIAESEENVMVRLEDELKGAVFGQDDAATVLVDSVFVSRAGLRDVKKPAGSYLFIGPTGVGKCLAGDQEVTVKITQEMYDFAVKGGLVATSL